LKLKKIEKKISYFLKRLTEYPLVQLNDYLIVSNSKCKIPKIVYQTWENRFFGKTHYKELIKFRNLNKNYSFLLFDKLKRDSYMQEHWGKHEIFKVYQMSKFGQMKADIFRYCILFERGGYYFDISKGYSESLDNLSSPNTEAIISYEPVECIIPPNKKLFQILKYPHKNILQWGLAFSKNHPILEMVINAIVNDYHFYIDKIFDIPKTGVLSLTATGQFTKIVREYIQENGTENLIQAGVYFNQKGIFSMKGSRVRHHLIKEYADERNKSIL